MSDKTQKCFFCNEDARVAYAIEIETYCVKCSVCDYYWLDGGVTTEFFEEHGSRKVGAQGKINCAHHNLTNRERVATKYNPIWVSNQKDLISLEQAMEQDPKRFNQGSQGIVFPDIAFESVDHSSKGNNLLASASKQLENDEPFGVFSFRATDRVRAKIATKSELARIIQHLKKNGFIIQDGEMLDNPYEEKYLMTLEGWDAIKTINIINNSKRAFIAMQFNWNEEDKLREQILNAIIKACSACGYEADVVGQNHTENITNKIITEIQESRFVVAEMTYNNRGVYFESGYARGKNLPVFHVVKHDHVQGQNDEGKMIHFDVQQIMYRKWETPEQLQEELTDWIRATVGNYDN